MVITCISMMMIKDGEVGTLNNNNNNTWLPLTQNLLCARHYAKCFIYAAALSKPLRPNEFWDSG